MMLISTTQGVTMLHTQNLELKQYFTDAMEVNKTMADLLGDTDGISLLEPSVGTGSLLSMLKGKPSHIDGVDIDPQVLEITKHKFKNFNLTCHQIDFIDHHLDNLLNHQENILRNDYDAIISNPPFGLKFSAEYRKKLKKEFPDFYVRESYGLFFILSVLRLRPGGRYVFLLPDSFLTSKNHTSLRRFICEFAAPDKLIRFPSKKFETVNFGYGNLCIITGLRKKISDTSTLEWVDAFDKSKSLTSSPSALCTNKLGSELIKQLTSGWHLGMSDIGDRYSGWIQLGELAECKTGIYTGDNARFIGFDPGKIKKRLNGHPIDWTTDVVIDDINEKEKKEGINSTLKYVPFTRRN